MKRDPLFVKDGNLLASRNTFHGSRFTHHVSRITFHSPMPELPEVESRLLYFRRKALGQCVERVIITAPNMIKSPTARAFARVCAGGVSSKRSGAANI